MLALLLCLLACPKPPLASADLAGEWRADPCGDRAYERVVTLAADGTYAGVDLVSPCPPDARCVWSGEVPFEGTWLLDGEVVRLVERGVGPHSNYTVPRPDRLTVGEEALVDGQGCAYRRALVR